MQKSIEIFFCYAREDEDLCQGLEKQLRALRRQGIIDLWHDRQIIPGTEWEHQIDQHLTTARIILLLISPDFMDSDYCYGIEMKRALERHERGEARVIPIILRPVYWQGEPLGKLQALPTDAKPITDPDWHNFDRAFYNVTEGIYKVSQELLSQIIKEQPVDISDTYHKARQHKRVRTEFTLTLDPFAPISYPADDFAEFELKALILNNHGVSSFRMKDYDEAIRKFDEAIKSNPNCI